MCNEYRRLNELSAITHEEFSRQVPVRWAGGLVPNLGPQESIRISDTAAIARRTPDVVELSMTPWAWKGPHGAPVFNFRSDGRSFAKSDRCLIPADGFFEFTGAKSPKSKHLFTLAGEPWFWIAGIVKEGAFTMLTTEPGPDIAPFHNRQIVVLPRAAGMDWLDLTRPEAEILVPLPAENLEHLQVR
jgi:putative SOS response-associated peptidase YedK